MGIATIRISKSLLSRLLDAKFDAQILFKKVSLYDHDSFFCEVESPALTGNCGHMDIVVDGLLLWFKRGQALFDEV